jgi:hypothetical protein
MQDKNYFWIASVALAYSKLIMIIVNPSLIKNFKRFN